MRSNLISLLVTFVLAAATSLAACASNDTAENPPPSEQPDYESLQDSEASGEAVAQETDNDGAPGQESPMGQQPESGEPPRATGPVATVDGVEIPAEEFNEQLDMIQQQMGDVPPQYLSQMQDQILQQLIQQQLLYNAIDDAGIEVTDEQVQERLDELREEFRQTSQEQGGEPIDFDDFVAQMGMSPDELDEVVEETVAIEMLLEENGMEMPTEEEVRAFYEDNPDQFTEPESVDTEILVIGPPQGGAMGMEPQEEQGDENRERAEELHRRATEEDTSFEDLADESDDVVSQEVPIARDQPRQPEELEETAFDLEDDEISEPVETPQGWLIVHRIGHNEGGVVDFEEVEDQLERELRNREMEEALQEYLTGLQENAEIERHPENIE